MSDIAKAEYVIFDVETTGLSPQSGDRIVEIAALKVKNLKPVGTFCSLVNPEREISYGAFLVNGITPQMLSGAPRAEIALPRFMAFAGGAALVGHNVGFDMGFLEAELSALDMKVDDTVAVIDTLRMSRGLISSLGSYSLASVAQALGIESEQRHRALADVELTWEVFGRLLDIAQEKSIDSFGALCGLFGNRRTHHDEREDKAALIEQAIEEGTDVVLSYFSFGRASTTSRTVTPKKLVMQGRQAVLIGFCHLRNEERSFFVDRIVRLEQP